MNLVFPFCRFIITVLVGSALVFGCFAAVASRFTRERFYAYFIAVRFAIIIILIWLFAAVHLFDGNYAYTVKQKLSNVITCVILSLNSMPAHG